MSAPVLKVARLQLIAAGRVFFETVDALRGSSEASENDAAAQAEEAAWDGFERAAVAYADHHAEHVAEQAKAQTKAEQAKTRKPRKKKAQLEIELTEDEARAAVTDAMNGAAES